MSIKQTITYPSADGSRNYTEDFYFQLTEAEIAELTLQYSNVGDDPNINPYREYVQQELDSGKGKRIMAVFKDMILRSYGERSEDGKRFMKGENQELAKAFTETQAYNQFFMQLVTDADFASQFFNGIMPKELENKAAALVAAGKAPSQLARERSEAQFQGHQQKKTTDVTELPSSQPAHARENFVSTFEEEAQPALDPEYAEYLRRKQAGEI